MLNKLFSCAGAGWHGTPISLPTGQSGRRRSGRMCYSVLPLARTESSASEICLSDTTFRPYALMVGVILFKKICTRPPCRQGPVPAARFPLLGLLLSLGCWVRAWQKPSKDPAVKTQNLVEKVSARDPARDPTTNLARKAQGVADQRCGPGQPHKVCNNRRWSRPFSPTSRQQSPGRL